MGKWSDLEEGVIPIEPFVMGADINPIPCGLVEQAAQATRHTEFDVGRDVLGKGQPSDGAQRFERGFGEWPGPRVVSNEVDKRNVVYSSRIYQGLD